MFFGAFRVPLLDGSFKFVTFIKKYLYMNTYSALEASVKLNISKRAVQKRCKKDNIRKKDNKYLITDLVIEGWAKEIESNEPVRDPSNSGTQELIKEQEALLEKYEVELVELDLARVEIKKYEKDIKAYEEILEKYEAELVEWDKAKVKLKELDSAREEIKALQEELSDYDVADNERLELFTKEEYAVFEERLTQWHLQSQHIISQQELFESKEKGLNDVVSLMTEQADHYKNQFQYQKEQATRILDMHEQLIKTIQQNNFIEAKSKGFDKE